MSEITLTIIKVLFLALLWLFILSAVSVIRSDLFGKPVATADQNPAQRLENPPPPGKAKRSKRPKGQPRVLTITGGTQSGESAELAGGMVMIGRGADCQLILEDDYVSTRHARVLTSDGGYYIEDLGSTNGTYVNGQRITSPTTITMSDTVRIGKTVMRLEP
ncbi:antibiotic biosynthesis regulator FhaB [Microlunatus panaciterrae]|uniref:PSer/pThr/pTyr-binding forkhead associated (FHA) protein n=1 Tax=Microlunatus panaciterrae TaxID=400768 RepID=A0ABS2RJ49_9ACTN|nr:FHA domain-containing protein [Microlunatus panaciterrae]MBM7799033.1 pSer/pThr/pTyr-binding forkhead associated (FHA) protein [Microlunatus panaciterrae]